MGLKQRPHDDVTTTENVAQIKTVKARLIQVFQQMNNRGWTEAFWL